MRRALLLGLALAAVSASAQATPPTPPAPPGNAPPSTSARAAVPPEALRSSIEGHLGRPYVWGSSGLKSFDCSGYVWRVLWENGILMKRTTARKLSMVLPKVSEADRWSFGNIVFFDNRKHCGIVASHDTFYHAATTAGTNLSRFDPLWRRKICGIRALPRPAARDTTKDD
jgi:cell wall-associated NlpC family hydrolase